MTVIEVMYVDHGAQGEYGPWGKVVARSIVRGMGPEAIAAEVREMIGIVGAHCVAVEVEEVPAAA